MQSAKPELGQQLSKPARFNPTSSVADGEYIYRYDHKLLVCKRSSINPSTMGASAYFKIIAPARRRGITLWRKLLSGSFAAVFVIAAIVLVYPWLPEIDYQLHKGSYAAQANDIPQTAASQPAGVNGAQANVSGNRLLIPKIGVSTAILEGPSLKILDKEEGVWHQTGTLADGNFVLAGHRWRYLPPNTSTLYNLDKVVAGDTIVVDWRGKRLIYGVTEIKTVSATQTSILSSDPKKPHITVYTCSDVAQTKRVVVIAEPIAL